MNAVEHGKLGIDYQQKAKLIDENRWEKEIARRLAAEENSNKFAEPAYEHKDQAIQFRIKDAGKGFDWTDYLEINPQRVTHAHGRGIAMAKAQSFSSLNFVGCGNEVVCTVALPA